MNKEILKKYFKKFPTLETSRLILRKMKVSDAEDMYEYAHIPQVTQYLTWTEHPDVHFTRRYLDYIRTQYADGEFFDWAIVLKDSGKMIGTCGFTSFDIPNNSAEVGYVVSPEYRGNGYAPEAVCRVMRFGFTELNLHRISARYMDGNTASRAVMDKCGMRYEGCAKNSMYVKGIYRSIHTCAILSDEYIKFISRNRQS